MTSQQKELAELIGEIRTAFNKLKSVAEALHADLKINPSMRAILQSLAGKFPRTVPDIAKEKGVSRQHVQKIMNALLADGLVRSEDNPDHKRSDLFRLTQPGEQMFDEVQRRETAPMAALAAALPARDVTEAKQLLTRMNELMEPMIKTGE